MDPVGIGKCITIVRKTTQMICLADSVSPSEKPTLQGGLLEDTSHFFVSCLEMTFCDVSGSRFTRIFRN